MTPTRNPRGSEGNKALVTKWKISGETDKLGNRGFGLVVKAGKGPVFDRTKKTTNNPSNYLVRQWKKESKRNPSLFAHGFSPRPQGLVDEKYESISYYDSIARGQPINSVGSEIAAANVKFLETQQVNSNPDSDIPVQINILNGGEKVQSQCMETQTYATKISEESSEQETQTELCEVEASTAKIGFESKQTQCQFKNVIIRSPEMEKEFAELVELTNKTNLVPFESTVSPKKNSKEQGPVLIRGANLKRARKLRTTVLDSLVRPNADYEDADNLIDSNINRSEGLLSKNGESEKLLEICAKPSKYPGTTRTCTVFIANDGELFRSHGLLIIEVNCCTRLEELERGQMGFEVIEGGPVLVTFQSSVYTEKKYASKGIFHIPPGVTFSIRNIGTEEARVFYTAEWERRHQ